jgi:hypothetical protein
VQTVRKRHVPHEHEGRLTECLQLRLFKMHDEAIVAVGALREIRELDLDQQIRRALRRRIGQWMLRRNPGTHRFDSPLPCLDGSARRQDGQRRVSKQRLRKRQAHGQAEQ